jgi:hypothetical protein
MTMDNADLAQQRIEETLDAAIQAARGDIPACTQGERDLCGEWTGRLINGACAPCRDRYRLD